MTLFVCAVARDGIGILADCLMTADEDETGEIESAPRLKTPFLNREFPETFDFAQVALRSKIIKLSKTAVLLYSGQLSRVREIASSLFRQKNDAAEYDLNAAVESLALEPTPSQFQLLLIEYRDRKLAIQHFNCTIATVGDLTLYKGGRGERLIDNPRYLIGSLDYSNRYPLGSEALAYVTGLLPNLIESELQSPVHATYRSGGSYEIATLVNPTDPELKRLSYAHNLLTFHSDGNFYFEGSTRYAEVGDGGIVTRFVGGQGGLEIPRHYLINPPLSPWSVTKEVRSQNGRTELSFDRFQAYENGLGWRHHTSVCLGTTFELVLNAKNKKLFPVLTELGQTAHDRFLKILRERSGKE